MYVAEGVGRDDQVYWNALQCNICFPGQVLVQRWWLSHWACFITLSVLNAVCVERLWVTVWKEPTYVCVWTNSIAQTATATTKVLDTWLPFNPAPFAGGLNSPLQGLTVNHWFSSQSCDVYTSSARCPTDPLTLQGNTTVFLRSFYSFFLSFNFFLLKKFK